MTGASAGEEEYVHVVNAEQEVFESLRSSLPDRYYDGRAPQQEGEQPPPQQHRRQRSHRGQRQEQEQEQEQGGEESAGQERGRSLSPPMEGWI